MDPSKARAERCVRITSTIDVPFLEKHFTGDVLVTCSVLSKLHCEDLSMRNPHCIGFNYKEHKCEIFKWHLQCLWQRYESRHPGFYEKGNVVCLLLAGFVTQSGTTECVTCPERVNACVKTCNAVLVLSATHLNGNEGSGNEIVWTGLWERE